MKRSFFMGILYTRHMLQFLSVQLRTMPTAVHVQESQCRAILQSHGGCLMTPQPSSHHHDLHCTFLEAAFLEDIGHKPLVLDFGLPTMHDRAASSYVCDYCKRYVFTSEADKM